MADQLFTLLYTSALSPTAPIDSVAAIAKHARARNAADSITGLLVFDGEHFLQFVQGPPDAIAALLDRLGRDARHRSIEVLHIGPTAGSHRFPGWRLGYLLLDDDGRGIERLRGLRGHEALTMFETILPELDVDTSEAVPA